MNGRGVSGVAKRAAGNRLRAAARENCGEGSCTGQILEPFHRVAWRTIRPLAFEHTFLPTLRTHYDRHLLLTFWTNEVTTTIRIPESFLQETFVAIMARSCARIQ